ncbi:hypothetical protein OKW33_007472 [Paraburkholderia atlantica]
MLLTDEAPMSAAAPIAAIIKPDEQTDDRPGGYAG